MAEELREKKSFQVLLESLSPPKQYKPGSRKGMYYGIHLLVKTAKETIKERS